MDEQLPTVSGEFDTYWDERQETGRVLRRPNLTPPSKEVATEATARNLEAFYAAGGQPRYNALFHAKFNQLAPKLIFALMGKRSLLEHTGNVGLRIVHTALGHNPALDGAAPIDVTPESDATPAPDSTPETLTHVTDRTDAAPADGTPAASCDADAGSRPHARADAKPRRAGRRRANRDAAAAGAGEDAARLDAAPDED